MLKKTTLIFTAFILIFMSAGCTKYASYQGTAVVTLNSQPQGANVFQDGRFLGTTPVQLNYPVNEQNRRSGIITTKTLTISKNGYKHAYKSCRLKAYSTPVYVSALGRTAPAYNRKLYYNELVLLERDPYSQSTQYYQSQNQQYQNQNINIRNQKDGLDKANSALDMLLKFEALSPYLRKR